MGVFTAIGTLFGALAGVFYLEITVMGVYSLCAVIMWLTITPACVVLTEARPIESEHDRRSLNCMAVLKGYYEPLRGTHTHTHIHRRTHFLSPPSLCFFLPPPSLCFFFPPPSLCLFLSITMLLSLPFYYCSFSLFPSLFPLLSRCRIHALNHVCLLVRT